MWTPAAQALRDRLQNADAELTAMTLALEEQRREAEETLTLLAAARAAGLHTAFVNVPEEDHMAEGFEAPEVSSFDIEARDWSVDLLTTLDIPPQWLPPCHEGPHVTGYISARAAEATGLKAGIPVVGGGGDRPVGADRHRGRG